MKLRSIAMFCAVALAGVLAVVYRFSPAEHSFYPRCLFYVATHRLCPGCGSTRALHALLHLDVRSAMHYNALFTLAAPLMAVWLGFCFYSVMRYGKLPQLAWPRELTACAVVVVLVFTIARNTVFVF